ncbi:MAG: saccharopine dehydrogenase NADP-binding domain-containing protein, partial [Paracoccaceae bacterium]
MNNTVLVLGGYGVFGTRLSAGLVQDGWSVIVAGRNLAAATAHCTTHGGTPLQLDRDAPDFAAHLAAIAPFAVIDAAGPYQGATHAVAIAALAAGAHALDLSDDVAFTASITALDADARGRGLTVISGASTVPALSSA